MSIEQADATEPAEEGCPHRPPCPGCPRFGAPGLDPEGLAVLNQIAARAGLPTVRQVEGPPFGHRHRARLAIRGRAGSPKIGLFQAGSHRIVDIPRCRVHHPLINRVAAALKGAIRETRLAPYADRPHAGVLRYAQVVVAREPERAQLVVVCRSEDDEPARALLGPLRAALGDALHSFFWNGHTERSNAILGPHWRRLHGPEAVQERIAGSVVHFPPGAFGQSNLPLAAALAQRISSWVLDAAPAPDVAEFHAGVGMLGLPILERGGRVDYNEVSADSLNGLEASLRALPPPTRARARIHAGAAGQQDALLSRLDAYDAVIFDPPRKGLEDPLLEALIARPPARLVYLSCGLDAFVRECDQLLGQGRMRLVGLEAHGLFPHTAHVETLGLFERIPGARAR